MNAEQQQIQCNVVEHDAGQDLIGVEARAQPRRQPGPRSARQGAGKQDQHQRPAALHIDDVHRQRTAGQRTEQQLTFGTDVPDARLIGDGQAQCAEQNRQGFDQQFGDAVQVADRCDQQGVQGQQRVMPERDKQQRSTAQGQCSRQQRRAPQHQARLLAARFKRKQHVTLR
ncbi:hypothetical protein D3C85_720050 [compost metagenome]